MLHSHQVRTVLRSENFSFMKLLIANTFVLVLASLSCLASVWAEEFVVVTSSNGYLLNRDGEVEKIVPPMSVLGVSAAGKEFLTVEGGLRIRRALVHYSGDFDYMSENVDGAREAVKKLGAADAVEDDPEEAVALAEEALKSINDAFSKRTPATAWFLQYLAYLQYAADDLESAYATLDAADALMEEIDCEDHLQMADLLNVRAIFRWSEDEHPEAISLHKRAVQIVIAHLGDQHLDGALIRESLSHAYEGVGDTAQAIGAQLTAIKIKERSLPASASELPESYDRLGKLYVADEQHQEASAAFRKALGMFRKHHSDRSMDIVNLLLRIGDAHEQLGEFEKSEDSYVAGLDDVAQMNRTDAQAFRKTIIHRQGLLDYGREQYGQALVHFFQAKRLYAPVLPTSEDGETWEYIGNTYAAQKIVVVARDAFVKALKIYAETDGETSDSVLYVDELIRELDGARNGTLDNVVMVSLLKAYMFDDDGNQLAAVPQLTVLDWNAHVDEIDDQYAYYTAAFEKQFGNIDATQLRSARMLPGYFDATSEQFKTAVKGVAVAWKALEAKDGATARKSLADAVEYCKSTVGEKSTLTLWVQMFQIQLQAQTDGVDAASAALFALRKTIESRELGDYPIEMDANSVEGTLLLASGEGVAAAEKFKAARDIAVERLGTNHVDVMELNRSLAQALFLAGRIDDAEKEMRETLRIAEAVYPPGVGEIDVVRLTLCQVLTQTESLDEAFDRLLTLTDTAERLDPQLRMMAFTLSGRVMLRLGKARVAREVFSTLLSQLKKMDAGSSPPAAMIHSDLGRLAMSEDAWTDAVDQLSQATSIHETIGTTRTFECARAHHALAKALLGQKNEKKALEQLVIADETFARIRRNGSVEAKETTALLKKLRPMETNPRLVEGDAAANAFHAGRFSDAKRLYSERLTREIRESTQPTYERATAYLGLAKLSYTVDMKAFDSVSLSNAVDDFRVLGRNVELMEALLMQAHVFTEQDNPREALVVLDGRVLSDRDALTPRQLLTALCFKSRALTKSNRSQNAVNVAREALQVAEREFGQSHIYSHSALEVLGHGLVAEGNDKAAADVFEQSRQIIGVYLNETVARKSYPELVSFLEVSKRSLHDAVDPLWGGETMQQALTWVLNEKNLLAEISARPKHGPPHANELSGKSYEKKSNAPGITPNKPSLFQELIEQAESQQVRDRPDEALKHDGKYLSKQVLSPVLRRVSVTDVRNALKPDELLIEFVYLDGEHDTYVVWVIPPIGERLYVSGENLELGIILDYSIDNAVPSAKTWIADIQSKGEVAATASQEAEFRTLVREFWRDVSRRIPESTKTIIFSLHGSLQRIPWAAMPTDGERMLIEDYGIRFVSSGRELVHHVPETPTPGPSLILADPDFDARLGDSPTIVSAAVGGFPREHLPATVSRLPGTAIEAKAILPSIARYAGLPPKRLIGAAAKEASFFGFRNPRLLHIATHGVFLRGPDEILQSRRYELTESGFLLDQKFHDLPEFNPLSRCGLLLAACNSVADDTSPADGILTGQEIVAQKMDRTELVVLSGCASGLNNASDPDGPTLLPMAFRLAGAETVIAPSWDVPDTETTKLMISFYQNLANGLSKTEALRQAQLSAIEGRIKRFGVAHPYFWAAFRVYGVE